MAVTLIRLRGHREAARVAGELTRIQPEDSNDAYDAACYVSLCVPLAEKDAELPESQRQVVAERYADRAVDLLREAIRKGYTNAGHMKKDQHLDPLRRRADFKKLLADLEEKKK